jgi:hypothetical protein
MGTVTGTIYKGGIPWPSVEAYFDIVRVFSDGAFSYPATRLTTTTNASGVITPVILPTPDNGSIQVRLTLPSRETILFWHSTADGDITVEEIILGAGTEQQIDTLATLLTQYLKLTGGTMTGPFGLVSLTTAERDALTPVEGLFIYNETDQVVQAYQSGTWVDYGSGGGGAVDSVFTRTGDVVAATSDYDASQVDFTPAGTIAATNVQTAVEEVNTEASANINAVAAVVTAHALATTSVHGITNTANLLTTSNIGSTVQSYSAKTAAIAALTWAADSIILLTGTATAIRQALAAHVVTFIQSANAADARTAIGAAGATDLSTHAGLSVTAHSGLLPQDTLILSKSATYEVAAGDAGKTIECSGTFTVTFPNGLDTGFQVTIVNVGAGVITLSAATTLQGVGTQLATQYTGAVVYHRGSNVWLAMGKLT